MILEENILFYFLKLEFRAMTFLKLDDGIELRSDESFRAQDHANHHRG